MNEEDRLKMANAEKDLDNAARNIRKAKEEIEYASSAFDFLGTYRKSENIDKVIKALNQLVMEFNDLIWHLRDEDYYASEDDARKLVTYIPSEGRHSMVSIVDGSDEHKESKPESKEDAPIDTPPFPKDIFQGVLGQFDALEDAFSLLDGSSTKRSSKTPRAQTDSTDHDIIADVLVDIAVSLREIAKRPPVAKMPR